jgi:hypothetical protein
MSAKDTVIGTAKQFVAEIVGDGGRGPMAPSIFVNELWLEFTGLSPQDALSWNWERRASSR